MASGCWSLLESTPQRGGHGALGCVWPYARQSTPPDHVAPPPLCLPASLRISPAPLCYHLVHTPRPPTPPPPLVDPFRNVEGASNDPQDIEEEVAAQLVNAEEELQPTRQVR